jgi:hypothetical protein
MTPLGVKIRVTDELWNYIITIKHPSMRNKINDILQILSNPLEIRRSKRDRAVYLYYGKNDLFICAVCKHLDGEGFLITAYMTDKMKIGEVVWKK